MGERCWSGDDVKACGAQTGYKGMGGGEGQQIAHHVGKIILGSLNCVFAHEGEVLKVQNREFSVVPYGDNRFYTWPGQDFAKFGAQRLGHFGPNMFG